MARTTKEEKVRKNVISKKETITKLNANQTTSHSKKSPTKSATKSSIKKETSKNTNSKKTAKKATNVSSTKKTVKGTSKVTKTASKTKVSVKKLEDTPNMKIDVLEYYDLPYRYNQTIVKLLFQTPKTLFVYWDITDEDRNNYENQFGKHFFENTQPVLIIHNETKQYTFEIEINDFANSWYFQVPDPNCKYVIELGRRPKNQEVSIPNNYLYITSSNELDSPNDHILFEPKNKKFTYKNIKTNQYIEKDFGSLTFMRNLRTIHAFYQTLYGQEFLQEFKNHTMNNPTSGIF